MVAMSAFAQKVADKIQSKKLNEERNFSVILPDSYENSPEKKYPILVLLDGEYLADPFSGILKYGNYWDDLPEIIIIAVNQNYGETRFNDSNYGEDGLPADSGAKFFEFIGFELLPYIQQKYRTLPFRMIAGHDTTAGFLNFYLDSKKTNGPKDSTVLIYKDSDLIYNAVNGILGAPGGVPKPKKSTLSPIEVTITIDGFSGFSPGQYFKIDGIPEIYNKNRLIYKYHYNLREIKFH